jgi:hypothetical protein
MGRLALHPCVGVHNFAANTTCVRHFQMWTQIKQLIAPHVDNARVDDPEHALSLIRVGIRLL